MSHCCTSIIKTPFSRCFSNEVVNGPSSLSTLRRSPPILRLPRFGGMIDRVEIDFPGSYSGTWTASIDSDDAKIFGGTPSEPEEAVLGECVDGKKHT